MVHGLLQILILVLGQLLGATLLEVLKSRERLPLDYTYGRTGKGICPNGKELDQKAKKHSSKPHQQCR